MKLLNKALQFTPNPSNGNFKISFAKKPAKDVYIQVFTMGGALVKIEKVKGSEEIPLNFSDLKSGTYILNVRNDGKSETHKILIK
jgi:hypothetical protein